MGYERTIDTYHYTALNVLEHDVDHRLLFMPTDTSVVIMHSMLHIRSLERIQLLQE